ncbi:MAG: hypothetical protein ABIS36_06520 [Chryseolinea sp.]
MNKIYLPFFFSFIFGTAFGQLNTSNSLKLDSVNNQRGLVVEKVTNKSDSLNSFTKIQRSNRLDSLYQIKGRLDSVQLFANSKMDSIQSTYESSLAKLQKLTNILKSKIDSLTNNHAPVDKFSEKLDSLSQKFNDLHDDLSNRIEAVKSKAKEKIDAIPMQPELKEQLSGLTQNIDKLGLPSAYDRLTPDLQAMHLSFGNTKGISSLPSLGDIGGITGTGISGVMQTNQGIATLGLHKVGSLAESSEKIGEVTGKVSEVSQVRSQSFDKFADSKFKGLDGVQQIQKAANIQELSVIKSQDAMKAEITKQAYAVATDHFAGKQKQLRAAMDNIVKYKKKFSRVPSISELPKRPPNAMKEKPLIERIVPGINMQMQKKGSEFMVDFNPYAGYRFNGIITAGLGWNHRVSYNYKIREFVLSSGVFGPRAFGEFRLGKGFCPRLEVEAMKTKVPPVTRSGSSDPYARQLVWGVFAGIKKEYKFIGRVKGTASVMVRLFDPKRQSPYSDIISARIGFEFPMKKNHK